MTVTHLKKPEWTFGKKYKQKQIKSNIGPGFYPIKSKKNKR